MKYNLQEAKKYAKEDQIEKWLHLFLNDIGNNAAFSEGLKIEKRYFLGPVLIALNKMKRCCGPEKEMPYFEPEDGFNSRVEKIMQAVKSGLEMPPIVIKYENGTYELNDGNHRHEAFVRLGYSHYWCIVWDSSGKIKESHKSYHIANRYFEEYSIEPIKGGQVKDNYLVQSNGKKFILSYVDKTYGIKTGDFNLPACYKNVLESGEYLNDYYELSEYVEGEKPKEINNQILRSLNELHNTPIVQEGYGFVNDQLFKSKQLFIKHFFSEHQKGFWMDWQELFNYGLEKEFFFETYDLMMSLLEYSTDRSLIHGDFHLGNIVCQENKLVGILDLDNMMYFDKLYDIAALSSSKGFEMAVDHYKKEKNFKERLLCMQLIRHLDGLRFHVKKKDMESYDSIKKSIKRLIRQYKDKGC